MLDIDKQKGEKPPPIMTRNRAIRHFALGWPSLGIVAITIWSTFKIFHMVQYILINSVFGPEKWQAGLRVIDNKGNLSDGTVLSAMNQVILYFGSYFLTVPIFVVTAYGLSYLNMRLHGHQLKDFPRDG